ncbi:uncharacterized protein LOC110694012 [Chenopodium quinoa]|uniref:uncharacterized protein LOC110694012 n=1 Tax=Chenopodium quinoa TaxID=63459 RepID=UPI000B7864F0|nr:uncharacterized protein LOC110694012 [Chenopodium quinoa]
MVPSAAISEASVVPNDSNQVLEAFAEEWKDLFKGKLNVKVTSLSFIAHRIRDGKSIAKLSSADICEGNKKWGNALIFYVVGYSPTISAVHKFIADNWSNIAKLYIFWHDEGYFIINLKSDDDKNAILCSDPHMFFGKPAIVKAWSDKFDFHAEILRTIPLWIKLPNIPLNCWGAETLSRIDILLGVPVCADECTSRQLRVSFARLLVELDVTKPLANSVWVESPAGELIEIKVLFEWKPPFCKKCNKVGHECVAPQKPIKKRSTQNLKFRNQKNVKFLANNQRRKLTGKLLSLFQAQTYLPLVDDSDDVVDIVNENDDPSRGDDNPSLGK